MATFMTTAPFSLLVYKSGKDSVTVSAEEKAGGSVMMSFASLTEFSRFVDDLRCELAVLQHIEAKNGERPEQSPRPACAVPPHADGVALSHRADEHFLHGLALHIPARAADGKPACLAGIE